MKKVFKEVVEISVYASSMVIAMVSFGLALILQSVSPDLGPVANPLLLAIIPLLGGAMVGWAKVSGLTSMTLGIFAVSAILTMGLEFIVDVGSGIVLAVIVAAAIQTGAFLFGVIMGRLRTLPAHRLLIE